MKKLVITLILIIFVNYTVNAIAFSINNNKKTNLVAIGNSDIIIVDDEGDGDFLTIQEAIDAAISGNTIQVYSGNYNGNISINKKDITLEGFNYELGSGDDENYPFVIGDGTGDVVRILSNNITLSGFIIQNSGNDYYNGGIGIYSDSNYISGNAQVGNFYGIVLNNCSNNVVDQNYVVSNVMDGIIMLFTSNNTISNCEITENGFQGIFLYNAWDNEIISNRISLNGKDGIHLRNYNIDNTISKNTIFSNNIDGIKIWESENNNNLVFKNEIYSNRFNGIHIMNSNDNKVYENMINLNLLNGIHIGDGNRNIIQRNTFQDNYYEGIIFLWDSSNDNLVYHNNIIDDSVLDNGNNQWDNGYPSGGNYWSYYSGSDMDGDGIGDTSVTIPGSDNLDRYPFMDSLEPPATPTVPSGTPVGTVGVNYEFFTKSYDPNKNKIQYGWDWDGDKKVDGWTNFYDSDETCFISHSWSSEGVYQVSVTAMDQHGFKSDWSESLSVVITKSKEFSSSIFFIFLKISNFFNLFNIRY